MSFLADLKKRVNDIKTAKPQPVVLTHEQRVFKDLQAYVKNCLPAENTRLLSLPTPINTITPPPPPSSSSSSTSPSSSSSAPPQQEPPQAPPIIRIALCFLIVESFPNELLWRLWLLEQELLGTVKVDVYIHCKEYDGTVMAQQGSSERSRRVGEKLSDWVKERIVKTFHLRPDWASLTLTKAMVGMIAEARNLARYDYFLFASESCIPILPLSTLLSTLTSERGRERDSWLRYKGRTHAEIDGYATDKQFNALSKHLLGEREKECVYKADQWILLSHYHCELIVSLLVYLSQGESVFSSVTQRSLTTQQAISNPIFSLFKEVRASDEIFFASVLALLGCIPAAAIATTTDAPSDPSLSPSPSPKVMPRRLTFCDWSERDVRPRTFSSIDEVLTAIHANANKPTEITGYWPMFVRKVSLSPSFLGYEKVALTEYESEMRTVLWKMFCVYFPDAVTSLSSSSSDATDTTDSNTLLWLWQRWEEESQYVITHSPQSVSSWFRLSPVTHTDSRGERGGDGEGEGVRERGGGGEGESSSGGEERVYKRSRYQDIHTSIGEEGGGIGGADVIAMGKYGPGC